MEYKVTYIQTSLSSIHGFRGEGSVSAVDGKVTFSGKGYNFYFPILAIILLFFRTDIRAESQASFTEYLLSWDYLVTVPLFFLILAVPNFLFRISKRRAYKDSHIGNVHRFSRVVTCSAVNKDSAKAIDYTFQLDLEKAAESVERELIHLTGGRRFSSPNLDAQALGVSVDTAQKMWERL